jgi:hypothetical protein
MAALQEVTAKVNGNLVSPSDKAAIAAVLWSWINEHRNDRVWTVRFWIISKTFTIGDLIPVFELLLGPAPIATRVG